MENTAHANARLKKTGALLFPAYDTHRGADGAPSSRKGVS